MLLQKLKQLISCVAIAIISHHSFADLAVSGTRVIIYERNIEASINVSNDGTFPVLMQTWIDESSDKEQQTKNLISSPPLSRINPSEDQLVRLHLIDISKLSPNQESLFWLNIMEIQPNLQQSRNSNFEIAYKHRLKVFYRPNSISDLKKIRVAPKNVIWSIKDQHTLQAENPTPYHINLTKIIVRQNFKSVIIEADLIPPFSSRLYKTTAINLHHSLQSIEFKYVNDWGLIQTQNISFN